MSYEREARELEDELWLDLGLGLDELGADSMLSELVHPAARGLPATRIYT